MQTDMKGKVAVVTGGGRGIGKAIALKLAGNGAKVAILEIDPTTGEQTAKEIRGLGTEALALVADTSKQDEVNGAIDKVVEKFGRIDILVNDAATAGLASLTDLTQETWDELFAVNMRGYFLCMKAVIPHMQKQKYGKIVSISSTAFQGQAYHAHYASSKAGVIGLTRSAALELAPHNINVNAVAPGMIDTPGVHMMMPDDLFNQMAKTAPLGRGGTPEDIANAVVFLASDEASFITGQYLCVCGGRSLNRLGM
jgi:NAD(P)-dependent dehydrogenase (short-subunit alcohol dehydrogenase family)